MACFQLLTPTAILKKGIGFRVNSGSVWKNRSEANPLHLVLCKSFLRWS